MGNESADSADASRMTQVLLERFALRVGPEMGRFVLGRLSDSTHDFVPVMGCDARTGVALRQLIAARDLREALGEAS